MMNSKEFQREKIAGGSFKSNKFKDEFLWYFKCNYKHEVYFVCVCAFKFKMHVAMTQINFKKGKWIVLDKKSKLIKFV